MSAENTRFKYKYTGGYKHDDPTWLRSYDNVVPGKLNIIADMTKPPTGVFEHIPRRWNKRGFQINGDIYKTDRLLYKDGRVWIDKKLTAPRTNKISIYGVPCDVTHHKLGYFYTKETLGRMSLIEESVSTWDVNAFRVGDLWYTDFEAFIFGKDTETWGSLEEVVTAFEQATWPTWRKDVPVVDGENYHERNLRILDFKLGRVPAGSNQQKIKEAEKEAERLAAEKKARRDAEDAEMASLEAELADLERQEKLKQLRAKVARMQAEFSAA
jgi:hypothetical protein